MLIAVGYQLVGAWEVQTALRLLPHSNSPFGVPDLPLRGMVAMSAAVNVSGKPGEHRPFRKTLVGPEYNPYNRVLCPSLIYPYYRL